ncbi:YscO family type III secretion system apparatus protein [uncultured Thiocystis sp.]|jgi:hypothetical protein|uniref:type III secretion system stalk subunit SctO n=1 Tax=uncultured Thiocystis sp. TaxID=1202134 RepID=UPI0025F0513C|nr:YscO family type III secretion system apparatus protein [uncultured Thiocystis sp.]
MSGTYGELLRIKHYREQLATQALRREQQCFDQQARIVRQVRDEAQSSHAHRLHEEQRRFEDIRDRLVSIETIEDMNRHVARLREQEALLNQRVLDEEKQLQRARQALDAARERQAASVRECEKFAQFVAVQRAIEEGEQMRREEQELEEIASAVHQMRREWT